MFTSQQTRLRQEGVVPLTDLEAPDNMQRLDLLEKRGGIFSVIDEVAALPQAKSDMLLAKIQASCTGHPDYISQAATGMPINHRQNRTITIRHSFGNVSYDTRYFLDDDGDDSFSPALQALQGTSCDLLKQLFPALLGSPETFNNASVVSRAALVKAQVASIRQVLAGFSGYPTFIHCVSMSPDGDVPISEPFITEHVEGQLQSYYVLESIMWQRFGYPLHYPVDEFWDRYYMLTDNRDFADLRFGCENVLSQQPFEKHHWQIGRTVVFLRPKPLAVLEENRKKIMQSAASCIGAYFKRKRIFRWMRQRKEAMSELQPILRGILRRQLFNRALEIAFMAFSERESAEYEREKAAESLKQQHELEMMREADQECKSAWAEISKDENAENEALYNLWTEDRLGQTLRSIRHLNEREKDLEPGVEYGNLEKPICELDFNEQQHNKLESLDGDDLFKAFGRIIADTLTDSVNDVVLEQVDEYERQHAREAAEQERESDARAAMAREEQHLKRVLAEQARRKTLRPEDENKNMLAEDNMMRAIMANERAKKIMQIFNKDQAELKRKYDDKQSEPAKKAAANIDSFMDQLEHSALQIDIPENAEEAQEKLAYQEEEELSIFIHEEVVLDLFDHAVLLAQSRAKTRQAIEESEASKRQIEQKRAQRELQMDKERRLREAKKKQDAAKKADEDRSQKEKQEKAEREAFERKQKADALALIASDAPQQGDEPASERIARFQAERRKRSNEGASEALNLQPWENIEDELEQMMEMLHDDSQGVQAYDVAQAEDEQYDYKYMYKYKYRALVLDDDDELPSIGAGSPNLNHQY